MAAVLLALPARGQPGGAADPKRFLRISKWHVTYTISVKGRGGYTKHDQLPSGYSWSIHRVYSGSYVVRHPAPGDYSGFSPPAGPLTAPMLVGRFMGWDAGQECLTPETYLSPVEVTIDDRDDSYSWGWDEGSEIWGPGYGTETETWRARGPEIIGSADVIGAVGVTVDVVGKQYAVRLPFGLPLPRVSPSIEHVTDTYNVYHDGATTDHQTEVVSSPEGGPEGFSAGTSYLVTGQPLPATGNVLANRLVVPAVLLCGRPRLTDEPYKVEVLVDWTCSPDPPADVSLVIMPDDPGAYAHWRPMGAGGSLETTPGNSVAVRAEVRGAGGVGTPAVKVHLIRFELVEVSREKGVCINDVSALNEPLPDLQFDPDNQPPGVHVVGDHGGTAIETAAPGQSLRQSRAWVSAYDFGAWGGVRAVAELTNGETIVGHVEGFPDTEALDLPEREPGSRVANDWLADHHVSAKADDADDDLVPVGDGTPGDGLTLYEEYRGCQKIHSGGYVWADSEPNRKTLFVLDRIGTWWSAAGIKLVRDLTKLQVIELPIYNLTRDRLINPSHTAAPHVVDQHYLALGQADFPASWCDLRGATPGTPKSFADTDLRVGTVLEPQPGAVRANGETSTDWRRVYGVAHLLLHGCNVRHHGAPPKLVTWVLKPAGGLLDPAGVLEVVDDRAVEIRVFAGDDFVSPGSLSWGPGGGGFPVLRRRPGDAASGDLHCIMRCWLGGCAIPPEGPDVRHVVPNEAPGSRLCTSRSGNILRGDAVPPGGDCAHQLRVSDRG